MKKLNADAIAGLVCVAVGAIFFFLTLSNPQTTFIATTSDGVPGAGFFPYILSALIMVMGAALVVRGFREGDKQYVEWTDENKHNLKIMLLVIAGLIVFLAAWKLTAPMFGNYSFLACIFLFEIYLNKLFERTWKFALLYAVIFTVFIYLVFSMGFSIQFNA